MAVEDKDVRAIEQFKGLRNTVREEAFDLGDLAAAANVDIDDAFKPHRRKGFSTALIAGAYHSLFSAGEVMVAGIGTALRRLFTNGTTQPLRSALSGAPLTYTTVGPRIYYSDGVSTGCVDNGVHRSWGLEPPSAQPVAAVTGGTIPPGTYQYAVTYLRSDGQESGTGAAGQITLTTAGGITFTSLPVSADPTVTAKVLYLSPVDGGKLFAVQTLAAAATTASYRAEMTSARPLKTQFHQPPIASSVLATFNGRVYAARGRKLYVTEVYAPELMDLRRGLTMPAPITLLAAVDDGLWVFTASEGVFLAGGDVSKFEYKQKVLYGAIAGTLSYANAEDIDPALEGLAAIVATRSGIVACLNGGTMKNLTKDRYNFPITERGVGVVRSHGGMAQYLMVLEGTASAGNTAF